MIFHFKFRQKQLTDHSTQVQDNNENLVTNLLFLWSESKYFKNSILPFTRKMKTVDINVNRKIPDEPAFFIHFANRMDPNMAPGGKDALSVIVPIGEMASQQGVKDDLRKRSTRFMVKQIQLLGKNHFGDLSQFNQFTLLKTSTKVGTVFNVYFVGASTQPGAGVSLVLCSALVIGA
uniref:Uncharacterized protein n=1 Tax=Tetranychus urticae TaxID=32264 RepID=T1KHL6_TETUR